MPVGNLRAFVERYVGVGAAGEDALDVVLPEKQFETLCHGQRDVLFLHVIPSRAFVSAAMSGIDDDGVESVGGRFWQKPQKQGYEGGSWMHNLDHRDGATYSVERRQNASDVGNRLRADVSSARDRKACRL